MNRCPSSRSDDKHSVPAEENHPFQQYPIPGHAATRIVCINMAGIL